MGIAVPEACGGSGSDTVAYVAGGGGARAGVRLPRGDHVGQQLALLRPGAEATAPRRRRRASSLRSRPGTSSAASRSPSRRRARTRATRRTLARRDGDAYVLHGRKMFVTNGREAAVALVFAQTDRAAGHRGISAFLVEKGTPGFTVGQDRGQARHPRLRHRGAAASTAAGCRRASGSARRGRGSRSRSTTLDGGRIGIAAQAVGIAAAAYEAALAYARERKSFGGADRPAPDGAVDAGRHGDRHRGGAAAHAWRAAWRKDSGAPYGAEAAMAKLFAAETAMRVTTDAIQVHGGYGFIKEYRSSATSATPRSPRSTRARRRSRSWSSPVTCSTAPGRAA